MNYLLRDSWLTRESARKLTAAEAAADPESAWCQILQVWSVEQDASREPSLEKLTSVTLLACA